MGGKESGSVQTLRTDRRVTTQHGRGADAESSDKCVLQSALPTTDGVVGLVTMSNKLDGQTLFQRSF